MNQILNIRGCGGSGKTFLVKRLMEEYGPALSDHVLKRGKLKPRGYYISSLDLRIVGRYNIPTGGCDNIQPFALIEPQVREYASQGHVLFEGRIVSHVIGRWVKLAQDYPGQYWWLFLDTPLDVCIQNILNRNGGKPIKENILAGEHKTSQNHYKKLKEGGIPNLITIRYTHAWEDFTSALKEVGLLL